MNIVVLAGGLSVERDVSLSSGTMVCAALRRSGHQAVLVDSFLGIDQLPCGPDAFFSSYSSDAAYTVGTEAPDIAAIRASRVDSGFGDIGKNVIEVCRAADIVYMGLHGEDGENGRMQAFFDMLGIRYTGTGYFGSAVAMHKGISKTICDEHGITSPKGKVFFKGRPVSGAESFGFPCVVKPCCGGSSIGVSIPQNADELERAIQDTFQYEDEVLVEEYITGREFSVGVLGDTILPPIEIIPNEGFYDYAHKYQPGWTQEICPAQISAEHTEEMQSLAKKAFDALKLEVYARGEFILTGGGDIYFLEMNTLPGMTPTSLIPQEAAAVGISYDELCMRVVELSMEKYR